MVELEEHAVPRPGNDRPLLAVEEDGDPRVAAAAPLGEVVARAQVAAAHVRPAPGHQEVRRRQNLRREDRLVHSSQRDILSVTLAME